MSQESLSSQPPLPPGQFGGGAVAEEGRDPIFELPVRGRISHGGTPEHPITPDTSPEEADRVANVERPLADLPAYILRDATVHFVAGGRASEAILERRYGLTKADAGLFMNDLERRNIVGPRDPSESRHGARPRPVLAKEQDLAPILAAITAVPAELADRFNSVVVKPIVKKDRREKVAVGRTPSKKPEVEAAPAKQPENPASTVPNVPVVHAAVAPLPSVSPSKRSSRAWNALKDLRYVSPYNALASLNAAQQTQLMSGQKTEWYHNRSSVVAASIGALLVAKTVAESVLLLTKGIDLSLGGTTLDLLGEKLNNADDVRIGSGNSGPSAELTDIPTDVPAADPGIGQSPEAATPPDPTEARLDFAGDTIWRDSEALLQQHGIDEPSNEQIADVKNRVLAFNGMSEADATKMAVGQTYLIPDMTDILGTKPVTPVEPALVLEQPSVLPSSTDASLDIGGSDPLSYDRMLAPGSSSAPVLSETETDAVIAAASRGEIPSFRNVIPPIGALALGLMASRQPMDSLMHLQRLDEIAAEAKQVTLKPNVIEDPKAAAKHETIKKKKKKKSALTKAAKLKV